MNNWVWWYMPEILELGRWGQEDQKLKAILGYLGSSRSAWNTEILQQQKRRKLDTFLFVKYVYRQKLVYKLKASCEASNWGLGWMRSVDKSACHANVWSWGQIPRNRTKSRMWSYVAASTALCMCGNGAGARGSLEPAGHQSPSGLSEWHCHKGIE